MPVADAAATGGEDQSTRSAQQQDPPYLLSDDKQLVAMYLPDVPSSTSGPIAERLLGQSSIEEDRGGQRGDHGFLLKGLIQARVRSVDPGVVVASFSEFGPEDSRPLARALLQKMQKKPEAGWKWKSAARPVVDPRGGAPELDDEDGEMTHADVLVSTAEPDRQPA